MDQKVRRPKGQVRGPITDSMHLDCVLGFGNARILKSLTEPLVPCCILALLYVVLRLTKEESCVFSLKVSVWDPNEKRK